MPLNEKQKAFAREYVVSYNATLAAKKAGYSDIAAGQVGNRLLKNAYVRQEIDTLTAEKAKDSAITAKRVLEEIAKIALVNTQDLFDEEGNIKPIHTLTREQAACIASLEVVKKNLTSGDGQQDKVHKVKLWDKTKALEMLGKHFALLTEQVQHSGEVTYKWKGE